jgi:hypothetical protein
MRNPNRPIKLEITGRTAPVLKEGPDGRLYGPFLEHFYTLNIYRRIKGRRPDEHAWLCSARDGTEVLEAWRMLRQMFRERELGSSFAKRRKRYDSATVDPP